MASIYKLKRKRKKEGPDFNTEKNTGEFSSLVFEDEVADVVSKKESTSAESVIEPSLEQQTKNTPVAIEKKFDFSEVTAPEGEEKQEKIEKIPKEKKKKKQKKEKEPNIEDSLAEQGITSAEEDTEELIRALHTEKVDTQKLTEVFHSQKATPTPLSTPDETEAIFREMFGAPNENTKMLKKHKKIDEDAPEAEAEACSLSHALDEVSKEATLEEQDNYIAVHDGEDEKTKEYTAALAAEGMATLATEGCEGSDESPDATRKITVPADEVKVFNADDDPYNSTYEEPEEAYSAKSVLPEEFTSYEEYDEFAEALRNRNFRNLCRIIWSLFAFVGILYLESATFSTLYHPEFLMPGGIYNFIFLLVDIQLVILSALLCLPTIGEGAKLLFTGKANHKSICFILYVFSFIHASVLLAVGAEEYPLFGSVAALFGLFTAVANFLDSKRVYRTFRVCGKNCDKLVVGSVGEDSAEAEAFKEQLEGTPCIYTLHKANFIEDFFARIQVRAKAEKSFGVVLILSLVLSFAFAGFSYWKSQNITETVNAFMTMSTMTLPLASVFAITAPFSHISAKAEKKNAAIVSTDAAAEYAAADVVSFTDREIFPPKSVKVTTIRTYSKTRIDKALLYAAMVFQKLGGPLSLVFKKSISGVYQEISEDFDFREITADGMCANIDGQDIFIGNKDYMLAYDFGYTKDDMDEDFEEKKGKIMYMVIGTELAAKFYIRYYISKQFRKTVLNLYRSGICPAVKTCDPNIDQELFHTLLQNDRIPAGIIKTCDAMKDAPVTEKSSSGIVCTSTIANLLNTFALCDSLQHLIRINTVVKIVSLLLGAGITIFLFLTQDLSRANALFVLIYQILWLLPIVIPSITE